jgi:hypothetical protein
MKKALFSIVILCSVMLVSLAVPSCSRSGRPDGTGTGEYQWKRVEDTKDPVVAVTAGDPDHTWAASRKGDILFSDGRSWKRQLEIGGILTAMCSLDAEHAWVVGHTVYEEGKPVRSFIYFYDGTAWELQYESEERINDVFALDPSHVWVARESGGLLFYDGSAWRELPGLEDTDCLCVAADEDGKVWAGTRAGLIYSASGGSWQVAYEGPDPVRDIYAADRDHAWAALGNTASRQGTILSRDGDTWKEQFSTKEGAILAVSGAGPDRVWAIGNHPSEDYALLDSNVYFFNGSEWSVQESFDETLACLFALDEGHVWAGGNEGGIYLGKP